MTNPKREPWQPPDPENPPELAMSKMKVTPTWHWIFPGLVFGIPALLLLAGVPDIPPLLWVLIVGFALAVTLVVLIFRALIRVGDKRPPPVVIAPQVAATQLPPAGWYPDEQGQLRWFDGQAWTDFRKPPEA